MKEKLTYSGYLTIGQHKSISVTSNLNIEVIEDDEFADTPSYNEKEYVNGVRIEGDLYFDSPPIQTYYQDGRWYKHPIQKNVMGTLSLTLDGESSRFNVILLEKVGEIEVLSPKKLIRYFWTFFPIGNPLNDKLEIFPEQYRWNNKVNRVYCCTNFRGVWPSEVASVVVAPDKKKARQLLDIELRLLGIPVEKGSEMYTLTELDVTKEQVLILNRG